MIPQSINIGPVTVYLYGVIIAVGSLIALSVVKKRASFYSISPQIFDSFSIFIPLILTIIFARLYHVLDKWQFYSQNPQQILMINQGGLGIWGGLLGVIIGGILFSRINKINPLKFLDLISPSLALAQAIGRIGNYVNQEGFGPPSNLPWAVYIKPEKRPFEYIFQNSFHPTFFYEAIIDLAIFLVLIKLSKRLNKPGQIFSLYLMLYSLGRFGTEFLRIDTAKIGNIQISHIISLVVFIVGAVLIKNLKEQKH